MASGSVHNLFTEETSIYIRKAIEQLKLQTREVVRSLVLKVKAARQHLRKLASRSPHPDPHVEAELKRLEDALKRLQEYAEKVIASCRNLAHRASNQKILTKISLELQKGQLCKLKQFLSQIHDYLTNCTTHVNEFSGCYQSLKQDLEEVHTSQKKKEQEKSKEISNKGSAEVASAVAAVGSGAAAVGFGIAILATGGTAAIVVGVITGVATAGAAISGGTSIGFGISRAFSEKELQLIKNATEAIVNIEIEMNNTKLKITKMESCVSDARELIDGSKSIDKKSLSDYAKHPTYNKEGKLVNYFDITHDLEDLQEAMQELKIIDEDD